MPPLSKVMFWAASCGAARRTLSTTFVASPVVLEQLPWPGGGVMNGEVELHQAGPHASGHDEGIGVQVLAVFHSRLLLRRKSDQSVHPIRLCLEVPLLELL
jgi:hypothetical protein